VTATARADLDAAVLAHLAHTPTVGLRELGRVLGVSRNAAHKAVRRLVVDERLTVVRLGTCAEEPSTYALPE
jgi:DNA-binding Lrp family transcriptional regulator